MLVATLVTPIASYFHSFQLLSWLATAYLIASAALQPLSGKLTDIYGRKAGLLLSNVLFLLGTLICGLANEAWLLVLGRVIAGLGGGCLNTITTFIASDLIPLRRRGVWQGIGNIMFGSGAALGGVWGGLINDKLGWRWAFLTQIPLIALSALMVHFALQLPEKKTTATTSTSDSKVSRLSRVDFLGSALLVSSLALLLLALNSGGTIVAWNHPLVYVSLPMAGLLMMAFVYVEERVSAEPVIPVRLLLNRTVSACGLTNWFMTMAWYIAVFYGPIYFQSQGYSAAAAGARLVSTSIGASLGSLAAGFVMRATGRYWWLQAATSALAVGVALLITISFVPSAPEWVPFVLYFFNGVQYGATLTTTLLALISSVHHRHQAVVTSISYAFRATGSTIGLAIAGAIFQNVLGASLEREFRSDHAELIGRIKHDPDLLKTLPLDLMARGRQCYVEASRGAWWTLLVCTALGAVSSLFMREHTLHSNLARR